jgi:hypothetical protein
MQPRLVYRASYNIGFFGFERLHPFDSRKYGRAWSTLRRRWGRRFLSQITLKPRRPVSCGELLHVHSPAYLSKLRNSTYLAVALEVPIVKRAPGWLIDRRVLRPMRWAAAGTILAQRRGAARIRGGAPIVLRSAQAWCVVFTSNGTEDKGMLTPGKKCVTTDN